QAFGVHADQHVVAVVVGSGNLAADQRHVLNVLINAGVSDRPEFTVPRRDAGFGDPLDVLLVFAAVLDQVGDSDQRQVVLVGKAPQLVGLRHRAFVLLADDFADRTGRRQSGHSGQVDSGLGVAWPPQHATVLGAQRNYVPGPSEIVCHAVRIGKQA